MITKTDAVVLKSMKFRDTSKIVTFYTRRFGRIKAIAKGARETKSKFGGALEPLSLVSLVMYKKEHRDLQLVSQCDILSPFKRIHSEIEKMYTALSVAELIHQLTHDEEENSQLFILLRDTLEALEQAEKNEVNLLYAFELRLSSLFGFAPSFISCVNCTRQIQGKEAKSFVLFEPGKGGFFCSECEGSVAQPGVVRMLAPTARILERLHNAKLASVPALEFDSQIRNEIDETLRLYLRRHFEEYRPLKSARMLEQISH